MMIQFKFSTCRRYCRKIINILTTLNTFFISIYNLGMLRICLAENVTFENCPLWLHHQITRFSHVARNVNNLFNKDNSPMENGWKDFSKEAPTQNMLSSSSSSSPRGPTNVYASIIRSRLSKHVMRSIITTFNSYLEIN